MPCGHSALRTLTAATPSTLCGKLVMSVAPIRRWPSGLATRRSAPTATAPRIAGRRDDDPDDARPDAGPLAALAAEERDATAVHAVAEDREGRGQEREAADDGDEDDADHPDGHRVEDVDADEEQARERDRHREPAEEHGPPGGARRGLDRRELVASGPSLAPEAGDHEQRVVDAHGEPDEDDELARAHRDGRHELAVDAEDAEARRGGRSARGPAARRPPPPRRRRRAGSGTSPAA